MLTNALAKAARPRGRAFKLADSHSLFLFVAPTGTKSWRMKFRRDGRERLLTFGTFPDVSLAEARAARDAAREQLRAGVDPAEPARKMGLPDLAHSFEYRGRRWHAHHAAGWSSVHTADVLASLERDVFPAIGAKHLVDIDPPAVLALLRAVEARGAIETAQRLRTRISSIFSLAISEGVADTDPAAIVGKALRRPAAPRHHPALLEVAPLRALLSAVDAQPGLPSVARASRFLALTAVRLAAVRGACWGEFAGIDWASATTTDPHWTVPAARMKLDAEKKDEAAHDHVVPLSRAAVAVLHAARADLDVAPGALDLVFPGRDGVSPIGEAAIGARYVRAGFAGRHVPHGWRASFSTILNEDRPGERDAIDRALAHVAKDKVEAAYNRAAHLSRRRALFERWAELLTGGTPTT